MRGAASPSPPRFSPCARPWYCLCFYCCLRLLLCLQTYCRSSLGALRGEPCIRLEAGWVRPITDALFCGARVRVPASPKRVLQYYYANLDTPEDIKREFLPHAGNEIFLADKYDAEDTARLANLTADDAYGYGYVHGVMGFSEPRDGLDDPGGAMLQYY